METTDRSTQELIESAERFEENGAIAEALDTWEAVLKRERDPVFLCHFGRLAMEAGKREEAREAFLEAAMLNPRLAFAHEYLGIWYEEEGDLEESLKHLETSLRIKKTAATYTLRGAVQLRLGKVLEARESFNQALSIDPHYEEAYCNLGITYTSEEPTRAITYFRKALELDPQFAKAHSELGQTLRRLNKNAEAEYHLQRAIELDETDAWAHIYLGNLLWARRDISSAEGYFKKAIDLWPHLSAPYWSLAMFYEYEGRNQEAEELYQRALTIDPNDPEANKKFGVYLKDLGETAKAREYLERALTLRPEDQSISEILAKLN